MTCDPNMLARICPTCGRIKTEKHETFVTRKGKRRIVCLDYQEGTRIIIEKELKPK